MALSKSATLGGSIPSLGAKARLGKALTENWETAGKDLQASEGLKPDRGTNKREKI